MPAIFVIILVGVFVIVAALQITVLRKVIKESEHIREKYHHQHS